MWVLGDTTGHDGLTTHTLDWLFKESPQAVTPASQRTSLLKLSRAELALDVDIVHWTQLTQKPSCGVESSHHKHTQAVNALRSFVEVSRLEVNKDESIIAREARTEDSHHDKPANRRGFVVLL